MIISVSSGKLHTLAGAVDNHSFSGTAPTVCGLTVTPSNYFVDEAAANSYTGGRLERFRCKHCADKALTAEAV